MSNLKGVETFRIDFDMADVELYLNTKYGYSVRKRHVYSGGFDDYFVEDEDGNTIGRAIPMFESDLKKHIISSMINHKT